MPIHTPLQFAFLVHPLVKWHRRILGVRLLNLPLMLGSHKVGIDGVNIIGHIHVPTTEGTVKGVIIAIPDTAERLAENQQRAAALQMRAAEIAEDTGARAIGLGNALAVVAGRGSHLSQNTNTPITTGDACTSWTCARIVELAIIRHKLEQCPIGILGFNGTIGDAIAASLRQQKHDVYVTGREVTRKRAQALGCTFVTQDEMLNMCPILIGANTTGPMIDGNKMRQTQVLIDLALPPTLIAGTKPKSLKIYAGEPLRAAGRIKASFWGHIWLRFAQYGRGCIYACLAEPILGVIGGPEYCRTRKRLALTHVESVGKKLTALGFTPVLKRR